MSTVGLHIVIDGIDCWLLYDVVVSRLYFTSVWNEMHIGGGVELNLPPQRSIGETILSIVDCEKHIDKDNIDSSAYVGLGSVRWIQEVPEPIAYFHTV